MVLARGAREESAPAHTPIPAAREAEHPTTQQVAREMLLPDRDLSPLPALTESPECWDDRVPQDGVERERRQQAVEDGVGSDIVEGEESVEERFGRW